MWILSKHAHKIDYQFCLKHFSASLFAPHWYLPPSHLLPSPFPSLISSLPFNLFCLPASVSRTTCPHVHNDSVHTEFSRRQRAAGERDCFQPNWQYTTHSTRGCGIRCVRAMTMWRSVWIRSPTQNLLTETNKGLAFFYFLFSVSVLSHKDKGAISQLGHTLPESVKHSCLPKHFHGICSAQRRSTLPSVFQMTGRGSGRQAIKFCLRDKNKPRFVDSRPSGNWFCSVFFIENRRLFISTRKAQLSDLRALLPQMDLLHLMNCWCVLRFNRAAPGFPVIMPFKCWSRMPLPQQNPQSWKSPKTEWAAWDTNGEPNKAPLDNGLAFSPALHPGTFSAPPPPPPLSASPFSSSLAPANEVSSLLALILRTSDSQSLPALWSKPWQR